MLSNWHYFHYHTGPPTITSITCHITSSVCKIQTTYTSSSSYLLDKQIIVLFGFCVCFLCWFLKYLKFPVSSVYFAYSNLQSLFIFLPPPLHITYILDFLTDHLFTWKDILLLPLYAFSNSNFVWNKQSRYQLVWMNISRFIFPTH